MSIDDIDLTLTALENSKSGLYQKSKNSSQTNKLA